MGLLSGLLKSGLAKKAIEEAKKPQNQEKAKQLVRQLQQSRRKGR